MWLIFYVVYFCAAPHPKCPYFDIVVGPAWLNDPESCDVGNVATGWTTCARQVTGDTQTKRDTLVLPVGGWV
jgi:hypothetical protein